MLVSGSSSPAAAELPTLTIVMRPRAALESLLCMFVAASISTTTACYAHRLASTPHQLRLSHTGMTKSRCAQITAV